jgi:hypothetical protein
MKKLTLISALLIWTLSADYHEPSISVDVDARYPLSFPGINLSLHHQSTFEIDDSHVIILHGLFNPHSHKTFHNELGVGFRRIYEDFGFGTNFLYAHQNLAGFLNHQLVPGVELYYKKYSLAYNRYLPIKTSVQFKTETYLFHDVSEITVSYRPSKNYEFSLTPNFNHNTKRFGYAGTVSAYILDNWKLSLTPYCEPKVQHGVAFSFGFDFGGAKGRPNARLKKSHRFFYTSDAVEVERFTPVVGPSLVPSAQPIILKPAVYDIPEPKEEKVTKAWWEYLLGSPAKK